MAKVSLTSRHRALHDLTHPAGGRHPLVLRPVLRAFLQRLNLARLDPRATTRGPARFSRSPAPKYLGGTWATCLPPQLSFSAKELGEAFDPIAAPKVSKPRHLGRLTHTRTSYTPLASNTKWLQKALETLMTLLTQAQTANLQSAGSSKAFREVLSEPFPNAQASRSDCTDSSVTRPRPWSSDPGKQGRCPLGLQQRRTSHTSQSHWWCTGRSRYKPRHGKPKKPTGPHVGLVEVGLASRKPSRA